jgi:ABC-type glycerol-3-phosphate transport system substrate-binding protein
VKEASAAFIAYKSGPDIQKYHDLNTGGVPTLDSLTKDQDVLKVAPFLSLQTNRVVRPSKLGTKYNQGSTFIFQAINSILRGAKVEDTLPSLQTQLQGLLG